MKKHTFKFIVLAVFCALASCTHHSSEDLTDTTLITVYDSNTDEVELARIINQYRAAAGKNQLQIVNHISYKSQEHNAYMIENNVVNHAHFDSRANNLISVLGATSVGENLAYNFSTPNAALNAWLNSPGHKANLDGNYTHFGISISTGPNGKKYYTNMFIKR